ncbi:MAG: radical SAM protein [Candidatus Eremiobacteraeota bacterium]|nr:radical SAM protein [Candidatus Eremiobacteraeota bacterium]
MLVFPPQWSPRHPHFGISSLAGHLRSRGHEVRLLDLNLAFYEAVLEPEALEKACRRLRLDYQYLYPQAMLASLGQASLESQVAGLRFLAIEKFLKQYAPLLDELPGRILDALETLRDPRRFYNPDFLLEALFVIDRALEVVSLPYHPATLSLGGFHQPDVLLATQDLIDFTGPEQRDRNLYYDFMAQAASDILAQNPRYIGISISSFSQVIAGLTLARHLRRLAPAGCHLNIGGNLFQRVKEVLAQRPAFFTAFCDSLVVGPGEGPVTALLEGPLDQVPDLLYLDSGQVKATAHARPLKVNETGIQDLAGLPLERYLAPVPVVCVRASVGCYWSKCTFCDTFYGVEKERKSLDRLMDELRHLKTNYGVRHFQFIDDCIPPARARAIADRLLQEQLDIHWFCNARLENGFTPDLMTHLKRAGLTMVLWGFESGSQRILDLIAKGTPEQDRYRALRNSAEAGLWNFAYIFFGFPTETVAEARSTITALCEHRDIIHSYGRSVFTLGKHSILNREREKYGILTVVQDLEELSANLHYTAASGMDDAQVEAMMSECTRTCSAAWGRALWFFLRYRESIHLYLARFGRDYVDQTTIHNPTTEACELW